VCFNDVIRRTKYDQALNNLAVTDDNKLKIVEAGALPHYVKLLFQEYDETIHKEALHGLWMMASEYKDSILQEPGSLNGVNIDYFEVTYCCRSCLAKRRQGGQTLGHDQTPTNKIFDVIYLS